MLNYVRAEFYKVFHRKYLYVTTLVLCTLAFLLWAGFAFTNAHGNTIDFCSGGSMAVPMLAVGLYVTILVGDMVFSDQYKSNTLKNEVSFGVPRVRIYLGKLAVEAAVGVGMSVLLIVFYEVLCYAGLHPSEPEQVQAVLKLVGFSMLVALPQWLGMLAVTNMFYFLVRGNTLASFLTLGVIVVPSSVLELTALLMGNSYPNLAKNLMFLKDCMPMEILGNMTGNWDYLGRSLITGGIWIVVSTAIGLAAFRRKEIN